MTQQPEERGIAHIRCADEDRELVAQVLNNAYADGRLDFEEHSERISRAYAAKTFGDLDGLTTDLIPQAQRSTPGPAMPPTHSPVRAGAATPVPTQMFDGGRAILSSFRPTAPLVMPEHSDITCVLGDVRLDLVGARFTAPQTTIRVNCIMGEVRIRVPEGVHVHGRVSTMLGDFKTEGTTRGDLAEHIVVLEGTSFMADVKVLGPDVARPRKYEKFI